MRGGVLVPSASKPGGNGIREVNGLWLLTNEKHPLRALCCAHDVLLIGRKNCLIALASISGSAIAGK